MGVAGGLAAITRETKRLSHYRSSNELLSDTDIWLAS